VKSDWERRIWDAKPAKSDINALILDYLTMEGYPKAAENFCKEANMSPQDEREGIEERWQVRQHILNGDYTSAIQILNEIDLEILEGDPHLHFLLLQLQLVELSRACNKSGDPSEAMKFAQEHLGPRAPENKQFLEAMEKTMCLLMIPHEQLEPQLASLLDPHERQKAAEQVNTAIVQHRSQRTIASIRKLAKTRAWAEARVRQLGGPVPNKLDIGLHGEEPREPSLGENGSNDTEMT